jgi:hypothetical protein
MLFHLAAERKYCIKFKDRNANRAKLELERYKNEIKKNSLDVAFESTETLTKMNFQKLSGH